MSSFNEANEIAHQAVWGTPYDNGDETATEPVDFTLAFEDVDGSIEVYPVKGTPSHELFRIVADDVEESLRSGLLLDDRTTWKYRNVPCGARSDGENCQRVAQLGSLAAQGLQEKP